MYFKSLIFLCFCLLGTLYSDNQTANTSPVYSNDDLPFQVTVALADFQLPAGLESFVFGSCNGEWVMLAGRTNGMHGFDNDDDNFPVSSQNTTVFVLNLSTKTVISRSLTEPGSGFSQKQIDILSVTAAQYLQIENKIYMVGGYGVDSATGNFSTKPVLTIIDIKKLISWVKNGGNGTCAFKCTEDPLLQVTGGALCKNSSRDPFLLITGQNYVGYDLNQDGMYTEQIRTFDVVETKQSCYIVPKTIYPKDPNYRRTDSNVVPIIQKINNSYQQEYAILGGGFTSTGGIWTVPIIVEPSGQSNMLDPSNPLTLLQGLNIYNAANFGLYSVEQNEMYTVILGGISYLTNQGGVWAPDPELPFVNTIATIKIDSNGNFTQYAMDTAYSVISSNFGNIGMPLLFGTTARFFSTNQLTTINDASLNLKFLKTSFLLGNASKFSSLKQLTTFNSDVFALDALESSPILLGYIVGGIVSSVANTSQPTDSAASPYIFTVTLEKN